MNAVPSSTQRHDWRTLASAVGREANEDRITLLGAGVAFYGLLSLLPALLAVVSIYGLVANPDQIEHQIQSATGALPPDARHLLATQLHDFVSSATSGGLGLRTALGIAVALWSASAGIKHLIDAINVAYEETETRGFVRLRATALLLTIGAALFVVVAAGFLAFLPAILSHSALHSAAGVFVTIIRFPLLAAAMLFGLSIVYRYGPDRAVPSWRWVTWGSATATGLWIVGSALFSLYASHLSHYNEIYGSLGTVIVLMLWLLLTALAVILGAEINCEIERGTPAPLPSTPTRPPPP